MDGESFRNFSKPTRGSEAGKGVSRIRGSRPQS